MRSATLDGLAHWVRFCVLFLGLRSPFFEEIFFVFPAGAARVCRFHCSHIRAESSASTEPSTLLLMSLPLLAFGARAFRRKDKESQ